MAIYAIIDDGVVSNMIVADSTFATQISGAHDHVILADELDPQPAIGWLYDSGTETFTDPNPPEE